jgi:hypothetical protein
MEPPQPRSGEQERPRRRPAAIHHQAARKDPNHKRATLPARLSRRHTHQLQPPWHHRRKPCVATTGRIRRSAYGSPVSGSSSAPGVLRVPPETRPGRRPSGLSWWRTARSRDRSAALARRASQPVQVLADRVAVPSQREVPARMGPPPLHLLPILSRPTENRDRGTQGRGLHRHPRMAPAAPASLTSSPIDRTARNTAELDGRNTEDPTLALSGPRQRNALSIHAPQSGSTDS